MNELRKLWWVPLIRGIILLALAFFVFRHPINAMIGVAMYIGLSLIFTGIIQSINSLVLKKNLDNWGWLLTGGLIDIIFGFVLLSNPALTAITLPFVVGFWIIISGIMNFVSAFEDKKENYPNWWLNLVGGILSICVGYLIMNNTLLGGIVITTWMAVGFAMAGILNMTIGFNLKNFKA